MKIENIEIIAPSVFVHESYSEAEILGAMLWLWSQFDYYGDAALKEACETVIQTIHSRHFALFLRDGQPFAYVNWVWLDNETLQQCKMKRLDYATLLQHQHPAKDKHLWVLSWFCLASGRNHLLMYRLLRDVVFKGQKVHFAYHKSQDGRARFYVKQC